MDDSSHRPALAQETLAGRLLTSKLGQHQFDRNAPLESLVLGLVDNAHATATQPPEYPVGPQVNQLAQVGGRTRGGEFRSLRGVREASARTVGLLPRHRRTPLALSS